MTREQREELTDNAKQAAEMLWLVQNGVGYALSVSKEDPKDLATFQKMQSVLAKLHQARKELLQAFDLPDPEQR